MATFAILSGKTVINVILADSLEDASRLGTAVEYTKDNSAGIGWVYNETTNTFSVPVIEEPNA